MIIISRSNRWYRHLLCGVVPLTPPVRPEKVLQDVRINHAAGEDQISFCHYSPVGKALMKFKGSKAGCMRGQHGMRDHIRIRKGTGGGISASSKDAIRAVADI